MKYSNSLENYCKSPLCASTIYEIESKLATLKSNHNRLLVWFIGAMAFFVASLVTFTVMKNGLSGLFVAFPILLAGSLAWATVWEIKYDPETKIILEIMGINYSQHKGFMETVQTPALEQVSSPLGKQLIEVITKQERKMRRFELILIESLCKF